MKEQEVMIIGGGLAGLVNAIILARAGFSVTLFEKKSYPRHKVCGEYISNEVKPLLQQIDAFPYDLKPVAIKRFSISSVNGKVAECDMPLGGFGISRYRLDEFLYNKALEAGANVEVNEEVRNVFFIDQHFRLELKSGQERQCQVLIGAHGKRSLMDHRLDRAFIKNKSPFLGLKMHYQAHWPEDLVSLHNFEGGYCGISRVEEGRVNFCFLIRQSAFRAHAGFQELENELLLRNPQIQAFLAEAKPLFEKPLVISNISFASKPLIEEHVLMCGDAAGMIHPLCGNGMAMAIQGAAFCSQQVTAFLKGQIDRATMEANYRQQWQGAFRARLNFGRRVQKLFGHNLLSNAGVGILSKQPQLLRTLVRQSHRSPKNLKFSLEAC